MPPLNFSACGVILGLIEFYFPVKPVQKRIEVDLLEQIKSSPKLKEVYDYLLKIYEVKYPHNPEGVLRYHINRELRSGMRVDSALKRLIQKHKVHQ